jgi:tryptophan-rich sensory protein
MADEHPTLVTTMAALAEPRFTESSNEKSWYKELRKPPLKASPAPVGLIAWTLYIPKSHSLSFV